MVNWHIRHEDAQQTLDEEKVKRAIDALLSYRRWEVLGALLCVWVTFLVLTFSLLVTVRLALGLPLF